jgi:hypothetical protein
MNHTTLAVIAVLAAAALVIGAVATIASPAFAGGHEKRDKYNKKDKYGDSSATITKQINKQLQIIKGDHSEGEQSTSNCITVLSGSNACRQQGEE